MTPEEDQENGTIRRTNHISVLNDCIGPENGSKARAALSVAGYVIYRGDPDAAIRAAENDALERAADAANWFNAHAPYGDAKHATVGEHVRALKHKDVE